jgi:DNA-binding MarR family transcriptional regulator/N-acetylglutamate synthase-like GNAT family acetyltransferase
MKPLKDLKYLAGATHFRKISEKLYVDGDKIYDSIGIDFNAAWFPVFYVIAQSNSPKTIVEIAHEIGFSHISVKNVLHQLSKRKLVHIKPNPEDKRSKIVSLSAKGKTLLKDLQKVWRSFDHSITQLFESVHPNLLGFVQTLNSELERKPLNKRMLDKQKAILKIADYRPDLKPHFKRLAKPWLLDVLEGKLEPEDKKALEHPDEFYLKTGGFVFFATYKKEVVGCLALKRLSANSFEFAKLFVNPNYRGLGIGSRLIQRCVTRSKENDATSLWLQTTNSMKAAHQIYYNFGFTDKKPPQEMDVLKRTQKIMGLQF